MLLLLQSIKTEFVTTMSYSNVISKSKRPFGSHVKICFVPLHDVIIVQNDVHNPQKNNSYTCCAFKECAFYICHMLCFLNPFYTQYYQNTKMCNLWKLRTIEENICLARITESLKD